MKPSVGKGVGVKLKRKNGKKGNGEAGIKELDWNISNQLVVGRDQGKKNNSKRGVSAR